MGRWIVPLRLTKKRESKVFSTVRKMKAFWEKLMFLGRLVD